MTYVILVHEVAATGQVLPPGTMVESYDPNGHNGLGDAVLTTDPTKALRFDSIVEAMECWRQTSTTRPVRPDGRPNRPLTSFTIEVVELSSD